MAVLLMFLAGGLHGAEPSAAPQSGASRPVKTSEPQPRDAGDSELKLVHLVIGIISGVIAVVGTLLTLARWMVFWPLETGKGRERLVQGVYKEFQSDAGRKEVGNATLKWLNDLDGGRATFQKLLLDILNSPEVAEQVAKLVATREASRKFVQENVQAVRVQEEVPRTKVDRQQVEAEFEKSTVNVLSQDPIANLDELVAIMKRAMAGGPEPRKEPQKSHDTKRTNRSR